MPARRRDPVSVPRSFHSTPRSHHSHDYGIDESISRAGFFSSAVLEDTDAAAARSRGKDYDLLRNTNSAIRRHSPDPGSSRVSRPITRYQSLPPGDRSSPSSMSRSSALSPLSSRSSFAPHQNMSSLRSMLQSTPSPSSLLSSKINMFLRGSSLPPGVRPSTRSFVSYKSHLDSATPARPTPRDDSMSVVSYKSHLADPSITSPFSTRSSSRLYRGFIPSSSSSLPPSRFRSSTPSSLPSYNIHVAEDDGEEEYGASDDDDEYEPSSYRRRYKILKGREALPARPSSTLYYTTDSQFGSDDEDDSYSLIPDDYGTYSCPRPTGTSSLALSSYEGPHDGSYEADMAEMYDYVPFGPSRQGILELTQRHSNEYIDDDGDDEDDDYTDAVEPYSLPYPSTTTLLTFPSIRPSLHSSPSLQPIPKSSSDLTSSPITSFANNVLFDPLLSSTAARARAALRDTQDLSSYSNASLVMSVEGSAISEDGKNRYGFKYYPPPIPIKGAGVGLDERILGITPKANLSSADTFFSDYLNRLKSLRSEIRDREDKADSSYGRSVASVPRSLPSYAHSTIHMPVHISGRAHDVPVSSYRSHQPDNHGLSHRVDVFPLLEGTAKLGKDKLQLPLYQAGVDSSKLTMLDKINIKAAIIGSKMEAEDGGKPKRKLRPQYAVEKSRESREGSSKSAIFDNYPLESGALHSSRPPLPKPTDRKAIRTVDGFTKPKNVMSWEYRLESRVSPDVLLYQPSSFGRLRDQVRQSQEKMDRHRQLLDRYLDTDMKPVQRNNNVNSSTSPRY